MSTVPGLVKKTGLAARREAVSANALSTVEKVVLPSELEHRIGIVFDDSGSMSSTQIKDAHEGCEEFLRSCAKDSTSVAIYPMNAKPLELCANLPAVALYIKGIRASGGTPLVETLQQMLTANNLTRAIVFSDGAPNRLFREEEYKALVERNLPVDTVYIPRGYVDPNAVDFMRELAERTKGIYLQFEHGKSNFRTAFKYLSPGLRYMLADKSFADKLQGK